MRLSFALAGGSSRRERYGVAVHTTLCRVVADLGIPDRTCKSLTTICPDWSTQIDLQLAMESGFARVHIGNMKKNKCVIILDKDLPVGLSANTAAVLGMGLSHAAPEVMGRVLTDAAGVAHAAITTIPVPVLGVDGPSVAGIADSARASAEQTLLIVDVTDAAQATKDYAAYEEKLKQTAPGQLRYLGIGLLGPEKLINSLTGSLPMLR